MDGLVHGPHRDLLARTPTLLPEPLALPRREDAEVDREHLAAVPEVLPRPRDAHADIRAFAVRQDCLRVRDEAGVPEPEEDARREVELPVRLCRDDLVHEREEVQGLVKHLDVDIEGDMVVFGLYGGQNEGSLLQSEDEMKRTFMSSATVSVNVGIDCLGTLLVLRCSMPPGPYQFCSLIFPTRALSTQCPIETCSHSPFPSVVLSNAARTHEWQPTQGYTREHTRVVKHYNHIVERDVHVCRAASVTHRTRNQPRE